MIVELVSILFACTAAVHLGLTEAINKYFVDDITILKCVKCLCFWVTLTYMVVFSQYGLSVCFAVAFLNAWLALWVELGMGYIDTLYDKVYETIYPYSTTDDSVTADTCETRTDDELPDLQQDKVEKEESIT